MTEGGKYSNLALIIILLLLYIGDLWDNQPSRIKNKRKLEETKIIHVVTKRFEVLQNDETHDFEVIEHALLNTLKEFKNTEGGSICIPLLCYDEFEDFDKYATDCAKLYARIIREFIIKNKKKMKGCTINICKSI